MIAKLRAFAWARFLRRRFPVHAEGWVYAQVPLFLVLYLVDAQQPLGWPFVLASLIAALWLVGVLVSLAALLRFPWWLLTPFCLISMAIEGAFDALFNRSLPHWRTKRWYLSNAVALWQGWRLNRRRKARAHQRQKERDRLAAVLRRQSATTPAPIDPAPVQVEVKADATKPAAKILPFPQPVECGVFEYAEAVWKSHFIFWYVAGFLGGWLWLASSDELGWLGAGFVMFVLWLLGSLVLILPLGFALLAALSALFIGAGMKPVERWRVVQQARAIEAVKAAATPASSAQTPVKRSSGDWVLPLALGLLIGSAWGKDD